MYSWYLKSALFLSIVIYNMRCVTYIANITRRGAISIDLEKNEAIYNNENLGRDWINFKLFLNYFWISENLTVVRLLHSEGVKYLYWDEISHKKGALNLKLLILYTSKSDAKY